MSFVPCFNHYNCIYSRQNIGMHTTIYRMYVYIVRIHMDFSSNMQAARIKINTIAHFWANEKMPEIHRPFLYMEKCMTRKGREGAERAEGGGEGAERAREKRIFLLRRNGCRY